MRLSVILLCVLVLLNGCTDFGMARRPLPDTVAVIVPESEGLLETWSLSPAGDKIAYVSHDGTTSTTYLLFPAARQKSELGRCDIFLWIDMDALYCSGTSAIIVIKGVDGVVTLPLKKVKATEVELATLLPETERIYRIDWPELNNSLLLRSVTDQDSHYLVEGITKIEAAVQGFDVITVPDQRLVGGPVEKVYSPDGTYYYNAKPLGRTFDEGYALSIYDAGDDSQLTKFVTDTLEDIWFGGWAADSSGVYFEVSPRGRFPNPTNINKILKLEVPETTPN